MFWGTVADCIVNLPHLMQFWFAKFQIKRINLSHDSAVAVAWHDIAALINFQKAVISLAEFAREPFRQIPSHVSKLYMAAAVKCKIAHYIWS